MWAGPMPSPIMTMMFFGAASESRATRIRISAAVKAGSHAFQARRGCMMRGGRGEGLLIGLHLLPLERGPIVRFSKCGRFPAYRLIKIECSGCSEEPFSVPVSCRLILRVAGSQGNRDRKPHRGMLCAGRFRRRVRVAQTILLSDRL